MSNLPASTSRSSSVASRPTSSSIASSRHLAAHDPQHHRPRRPSDDLACVVELVLAGRLELASAQSQSPVRRTSSATFPIVLISSARRPSRRAVVMISRWTATASDGSSSAVMLAIVVAKRMARSEFPICSAISMLPRNSARASQSRPSNSAACPMTPSVSAATSASPRRSALASASRDRSSDSRYSAFSPRTLPETASSLTYRGSSPRSPSRATPASTTCWPSSRRRRGCVRIAQQGDGQRDGTRVGARVAQPHRIREELDREVGAARPHGGSPRLLEHVGTVRVVHGDIERLAQVGHGLHLRPELLGAGRRRPEREPRLRPERLRLAALARRPVGGHVVGRERARELVVAEPLEVAGRREVPRPPVAEAERRVGDLPDEGLDERVLAALGRPRVDLDVDQVAPDELREARLQLRGRGRRRPRRGRPP